MPSLDASGDSYQDAAEQRELHDRYFAGQDAAESVEEREDIPPDIKRPPEPLPDPTLDERRKWHAYHQAGLPWTAEFEEAVNEGLVDVS
ncbi:MAG: hypothetical protein HY323_05375 [Betaproteobacteria bacterium]|nr:hypothetical protein [Betaproteobacteria bacterium]